MTLIFAVDPGGAHKKFTKSDRGTGWCLMEVTGQTSPPALVDHGQVVGGPDEFISEYSRGITMRAAMMQADVVVTEDFVLLNARANTDPLEIIGMVRMFALEHGKTFVKQMPGKRKATDHDDLKRIGMWPGGAGHADTAQAIRHALAYLLNSLHRGTMIMVQPDDD